MCVRPILIVALKNKAFCLRLPYTLKMLNFDNDAFHSPAFGSKNLLSKANLRLTHDFCVLGCACCKFDSETMSNVFAGVQVATL